MSAPITVLPPLDQLAVLFINQGARVRYGTGPQAGRLTVLWEGRLRRHVNRAIPRALRAHWEVQQLDRGTFLLLPRTHEPD